MNPDDLRRADAIEVVVGQGAKPGGGGMLLGHKISDRVAEMRTLPKGIDQRSACRHPDWNGPDDLEIKIGELRELTDWQKPIFVKVGATRTYYDVALAVEGRRRRGRRRRHAGRHRGHAGRVHRARRHPHAAGACALAVEALQELDMHRKVQLIVSGGIRSRRRRRQGARPRRRRRLDRRRRADRAGRQRPELEAEYERIGARPATTTTGRPGATRRASRRRIPSSPRGSIPSWAAAAWPTTCAA